jgi:hypothetical protein
MQLVPCRHLDFEEESYPTCELVDLSDKGFPGAKHWIRQDPEGNPQNVQFCKQRGRIYGIFQCLQPGEMCCYKPTGEE